MHSKCYLLTSVTKKSFYWVLFPQTLWFSHSQIWKEVCSTPGVTTKPPLLKFRGVTGFISGLSRSLLWVFRLCFQGQQLEKHLCWKPLIHATSNLTPPLSQGNFSDRNCTSELSALSGIARTNCCPTPQPNVIFFFWGSYSSSALISLILFPLPFLNSV